ncbi:hypothetical protein EJ08DRAFT_645914 [Tothia fuscella]|uniref:Uncharacterized protein n=1 Tax=Tothia fuscella TaxID=1048955 RepID=A0A9P4P131_9PEZI|nr:hypothetical protein EJ08DRAFT_645914 [Tothia fuscella]
MAEIEAAETLSRLGSLPASFHDPTTPERSTSVRVDSPRPLTDLAQKVQTAIMVANSIEPDESVAVIKPEATASTRGRSSSVTTTGTNTPAPEVKPVTVITPAGTPAPEVYDTTTPQDSGTPIPKPKPLNHVLAAVKLIDHIKIDVQAPAAVQTPAAATIATTPASTTTPTTTNTNGKRPSSSYTPDPEAKRLRLAAKDMRAHLAQRKKDLAELDAKVAAAEKTAKDADAHDLVALQIEKDEIEERFREQEARLAELEAERRHSELILRELMRQDSVI